MCKFVGFITGEYGAIPPYQQLKEASKKLFNDGKDNAVFYGDSNFLLFFKNPDNSGKDKKDCPVFYQEKRFLVVLKGQIYNYPELKNKLEDAGGNINTCPKIIIALYKDIGGRMLTKLRGAFSFLLWDRHEKKLFGAIDYFGIKPLYYLKAYGGIFFSTEKKCLISLIRNIKDNTQNPLNEKILQHYLTFQYPPGYEDLYRPIKKVPPGNYFTFTPSNNLNGNTNLSVTLSFNRYFDPLLKPKNSYLNQKEELYEAIKEILKDSVKIHIRSNEPVGAFLSSGIDSTSIVALAKKFKPGLKTFTSGFQTEDYDTYNEADVAKNIASELKVEHYTRLVTPEEIMRDLPTIIWYMDAPVADPASIPLYYVSKEASKHVKVILSGEGADELFGGYNIYREPADLKAFSHLPFRVRKSLYYLAKIIPEGVKGKDFLRRSALSIEERYYGNARIFREEEKKKFYKKYSNSISYKDITRPYYQKVEKEKITEIETMQYIDLKTWLPGDILIKANRMTTANSIELRAPFLDISVFELAKKIPAELKITEATTKLALRKALEDEIPASILYRKKLGFPVPIRSWLKDIMFEWANEIIKKSSTNYLFNKKEIFKLLKHHRKGYQDHSRKLWTLITFMLWHKIFIEECM